MQAVILSAGRGTRMGHLTESLPKPLLEINGKTLLEHKFDALPKSVDEIILVVGYLGSMIQKRLGGEYKGKKILYVVQDNPEGGTADALWSAKNILKGKFLVMYGDDLYAAADMGAVAKSKQWALCALKLSELGSAAKIVVNKKNEITEILEGADHKGGEGFCNTGLYLLDESIFDATPVKKSPHSDEIGLPQTMVASKKPIHLIPATFWMAITTPHDLKKAEDLLAKI